MTNNFINLSQRKSSPDYSRLKFQRLILDIKAPKALGKLAYNLCFNKTSNA